MHKKIKLIKKNESPPFIIKNALTKKEIKKIQNLYKILPIEINNKRQKIKKKKWIMDFHFDLQKIIMKKVKKNIGNFKLDNPKTKSGLGSFGCFKKVINQLIYMQIQGLT